MTLEYRGKTAIVEMTVPALGDMIADMEYQVEFADSPYEAAYRAKCRRALATLVAVKAEVDAAVAS